MLPTKKTDFKLNPYFCALLPLTMHSIAFALPTDGVPTNIDGASISTGSGYVLVQQSAPNVLINWSSFSTSAGEIVEFRQPNANSIAVNRVTGPDASFLDGALNANGRVFVINPNGVLFGAGSEVNVGGLLATTFDISDEDFNAGRFIFRDNGTGQGPHAGLVSNAGRIRVGIDGRTECCVVIPDESGGANDGSGGEIPEIPPGETDPRQDGNNDGSGFITAEIESSDGGFAILAGQKVVNTGRVADDLEEGIFAPNGQIVLASGSSLTISFDSGMISYEVTPQMVAALNEQIKTGVINDGTLVADGGAITLIARASNNVAGYGIFNNGEIRAQGISFDDHGGIYLTATGGEVSNTGVIDASGTEGSVNDGPLTFFNPQSVRIESDKTVTIETNSEIEEADRGAILADGPSVTPNGDGSSSPGTIFIRGSQIVLNGAQISGSGEVRLIATAGNVTDFSAAPQSSVGVGSGPSINEISGSALGVQASGSINLGASSLYVGTGETFIGGDPSVGDRPGLIEQLRALYPPSEESVALASPRADGIQLDEVPDSPSPTQPAFFYIPDHERPNASFVTGKDGSVQLGGSGGSLSMQGDYLYLQTNVFDFRLAPDFSVISDFQTADFVSPYPLFMQYVPAVSGGSVGFEQNLAPNEDLNLSPASFANFPGATLVFGSTANPGDVVIGDDGPVTSGTNGFNYVLAAGPGGLIFNPDGIETDGEVVVLGQVARDGPTPPIDPPRIPDVLFPSPLPPGQTAEFVAARSEPVSSGAPDLTFDLAAALDTSIQYKSAEGPVLACQ